MPVYAKKVQSTDPTFHDRTNVIASSDMVILTPVPNSITLCNGCNKSIPEGYLVYLGKRELNSNQPYDYYCQACLKSYFPKAIIVE